MRLRNLLHVVLAIVLIVIGVFVGKWIDFPFITIDPSINLLHGLSILTTLFIAMVLSIHFDTQKKRDSTQKEIMIKRVDKVIEILDKLQGDVAVGKVGLQFAVAFTKRFNGIIGYIWSAFETHKIDVSVTQVEIKQSSLELRKLLTTTQDTQSNPNLATIADDSLVYSAPKIAEIIAVIERLKNMLFKVQLDINAN